MGLYTARISSRILAFGMPHTFVLYKNMGGKNPILMFSFFILCCVKMIMRVAMFWCMYAIYLTFICGAYYPREPYAFKLKWLELQKQNIIQLTFLSVC